LAQGKLQGEYVVMGSDCIYSDGMPAVNTRREDVLAASVIRAEFIARRVACHPPGCETSLLRAGVRAGFAQGAAGPALGAFSGESGDTEAKNG